MPFIKTDGTIGIRGLMNFRPDTGMALNQLAQALLVDNASLSRAEREMIASFVSHQNECAFCMKTHGAIAAHLPDCNAELMQSVWDEYTSAPVSDKLKALLKIADKVRVSGRNVTTEDIANARAHGANDLDIHDTVLIAAAFCMFNRYVDGLGASVPTDQAIYDQIGRQRAEEGYLTKSILNKGVGE